MFIEASELIDREICQVIQYNATSIQYKKTMFKRYRTGKEMYKNYVNLFSFEQH